MMSNESPGVVELRNVSKAYGRAGVEPMDLGLGRGEIVCLLGPSGCGKTTTLRIIAGFVQPDAGTVLISGEDVTGTPPYRRDIGIVFQSYALFPHLSVAENIAFGLENLGRPQSEIRSTVAEMIELVELQGLSDRRPKQLSGGQQHRVALARALALKPAVLLLDEPFSNLDSQLRTRMQTEVAALLRRVAITTLLVTHDQGEAFAVADRVVVMSAGRVEQIGTPEQIYTRPASRFVAEFVGTCTLVPGRFEGTRFIGDGGLSFPTDGRRAGRAVAVVRPEAVRLAAEPDGATATVVEKTYFGSSTRLTLKVGELPLILDAPGASELRVGQRVGVVVDGASVAFVEEDVEL